MQVLSLRPQYPVLHSALSANNNSQQALRLRSFKIILNRKYYIRLTKLPTLLDFTNKIGAQHT
jgi:hypothetical protein